MKIKKWMALLMAMLLTIGNIPVSAFAAEPQIYAMDGEAVVGGDDEILVNDIVVDNDSLQYT